MLDRSSATVKLFDTLIVFKVLVLLLKYCDICLFLLVGILQMVGGWWSSVDGIPEG